MSKATIYLPIPNTNNEIYVSEYGTVISWKKCIKKFQKMKSHSVKNGYVKSKYTFRGVSVPGFCHRFVALAFIGEPKDDLIWVNHIDGNKKNNHYSNLEYCTHQYNMKHAAVNNLMSVGQHNHKTYISNETAIKIYKRCLDKVSTAQIAREFGVSHKVVARIRKGRSRFIQSYLS